jgi:RimJ/RimL family protein N-acetyltransferase
MDETKQPVTTLLPQFDSQVATRDNVALNIRPANPHDEQVLIDFFGQMKPQELRYRFLTAIKRIWPRLAYELVNIDHAETENLLAFDDEGELVASAVIAASDHIKEDAEIAITVRSDLKEHGIGWTMLERACDYARSRGYRRVHSVQFSDDQVAINLQEEMGFHAQPCLEESNLTILSKDLLEGECVSR